MEHFASATQKPEKETRIYLVRHGQSLGNCNRVFVGQTEVDMTELGYMQAKETAAHLANADISAVYASDLSRAYNTALPHAKLRGVEVIKSKGMRELYVGKWEQQPADLLLELYPDTFGGTWKHDFLNSCPDGGESVPDLIKRIHNELLRIAKENAGKTILVVSHGAAIRAFWCSISNLSGENIPGYPSNASYSTIVYDGEKFIPVAYSCDEHLSNISNVSSM